MLGLNEGDRVKDSHQETFPEDSERHVSDSKNADGQEISTGYTHTSFWINVTVTWMLQGGRQLLFKPVENAFGVFLD